MSRPRTPAFLQIGFTIAIAVVLAAVTLTTRQPPPPAIAEFAPQAAEQIKEAPKEQSSQFGSGSGEGDCPPGAACAPGGGSGGSVTTTTTTDPAASTASSEPSTTVGPASVKRCVGDPPRQIEDPQSPPCIPFWDDSKGNGGATSFGVTKDTITLVADGADTDNTNLYSALAKFFNKRFQFYGRQLKIVQPEGSGTARADSAKQLGAFASLTSYSDPPYYRQLVRNKIIGVYRTTDFSDTELAAAAPYLWGYTMSFSQILGGLGDWSCRRLVGAKAKHAGQALAGSDRSFGIFLQLATPDSALKADILKSALEQCGAKVHFVSTYDLNYDGLRDRNEIAELKSKGVSTLFCLCRGDNLDRLQYAADSQAYEPEWVISNYPQLIRGDPRNGSQMNRTFGVSFEPMDRVPEDHPSIWAMSEGDPNNPNARTRDPLLVTSNDIHYRGFLALASGIQMAGPNLTPETFQAGLRKTRFPNPETPLMAGKVGFEGDFSMTNDGAEFWNSNTSPGPYDTQESGPAFCWVNGGRRYNRGGWPKGGDPFFTGPCDSGNRSVS